MISIFIFLRGQDRPPFICNLPQDENGFPIFSELSEPILSQAQKSYSLGSWKKMTEISPMPIADWDGLLNRLLSGDLNPLFRAITLEAFSNPVLLVARNDIYGALSNPKIIDRMSTLRAGLDMLLQSGYQISDSDRILWNTAIAELNFPDEVKL